MFNNLPAVRTSTSEPDFDSLPAYTVAAKQADTDAQAILCGAMIWAAFAAPGAIPQTFDCICRAQLGLPVSPRALVIQSTSLGEEFWLRFEEILVGPKAGYDATLITVAVASLNAALDPSFAELSEAAAILHSGADNAQTKPVPAMILLSDLAEQPEGSLARELLAMWVENGFDPEVLDREAIGLGQLSPALHYLNTRILQMHDIWHLVGGYQTTSLHEMAISAFQLAQFGHNYSAQFLATVGTMSYLHQPQGFSLLLQNMAEAWVHGCDAPHFMNIEWEQDWHLSKDEVRQKYGIKPFAGSFPPDLLEQLSQGS